MNKFLRHVLHFLYWMLMVIPVLGLVYFLPAWDVAIAFMGGYLGYPYMHWLDRKFDI